METVGDLVKDSNALIEGYLDPDDREQLYNRRIRWSGDRQALRHLPEHWLESQEAGHAG
jgi:hypothetical protein